MKFVPLFAIFSFILLLFACISTVEKTEQVLLDIPHMQQVSPSLIENTNNSLIALYAYRNKSDNSKIPCADVFVCKFFKDTSSKNADTVVLLDTHIGKFKRYTVDNPDIYEIKAKSSRAYKSCRVSIPAKVASRINFYRYMFASVTLVTDD